MDPSDNIYDDPQKLFQAMTAGNPKFPMPVFLSYDESKLKAAQYSEKIFDAQRTIVTILDRYEEKLIKRWLKKTTAQRQKILMTAYPRIPSTHRPDFWAIRKENEGQVRAGTQYRDHWLLPSINLEDLSKSKNLLLFLRSRARNPSGVFVNADANSVHLGHVTQALVPPYLSGYTMLLSGQNTPKTYGRMISWDEDDTAFDMMSTGVGLQPGEGLQVMETQQRKLQFLQKCVEIILQDLALNDSSVPTQPTPTFEPSADHGSEWPSLTQEVEEAPYKVPDVFNFARLRTFVEARRNEGEDHIWALREDPSYFQDVIAEESEHRQEKILTENGKTHPVLRQDTFWERVLSNVVMNAYTDLVAWDIVLKEIDSLIDIRGQSGENYPGSELHGNFMQALAHFEHLVEQLIKGAISKWKVGLMASPPLRQLYVREPQDPSNTRIRCKSRENSRKKDDHLLWLLEVILQDDQLFLCGLENVCDELERETRSNRPSRDRISPYIANLISELSLLGELKRQIGLATPGPKMTELLDEEEKQAEFGRKTQLLSEVYGALSNVGKGLAGVGTPLGKFNYPSDKRRTLATTQKMQLAEESLDAFWKYVDEHCKKTANKTVHQMLIDILIDRELQRTCDWQEPVDESLQREEHQKVEPTTSQFAALVFGSQTEKTMTFTPLMREKPKIKTRGIPQNSSSLTVENTELINLTNDKDSKRIFNVSKAGFKVFTTLFYTPTENQSPGEISWSQFLSAMASVGFSINKLNGSAWVFAPADDDWKQSIIFHEPHPSSRIPFQVARRFGRRLWRTYGWTSENFRRA